MLRCASLLFIRSNAALANAGWVRETFSPRKVRFASFIILVGWLLEWGRLHAASAGVGFLLSVVVGFGLGSRLALAGGGCAKLWSLFSVLLGSESGQSLGLASAGVEVWML